MAQFKTITDSNGKEHYYSFITSTKWSKGEYIKLGNNKRQAYHFHELVENKEKDIKDGMTFEFHWLKPEGGKTTIRLTFLGEVVEEWLELVRVHARTKGTPERYRVSFNTLYSILKKGKHTPIRELKTKMISDYKKHYAPHRRHKGINSDLRALKVFCRWCVEEGKLKEMPKFRMFREEYEKPRYINEKNWEKILQLESLSDWWKDVFSLYHSSGMRLGEPVHGTVDGNILNVPAKYSKARRELDIPLSDWQVDVVKKIHVARDECIAKGSRMKTFKGRFSKKFKDVLVELGIYERYYTHFHCLRNTYAVMRWYQTGDIHLVCKELNHTTIKMTQMYADFEPIRLKQDFPSITREKTR